MNYIGDSGSERDLTDTSIPYEEKKPQHNCPINSNKHIGLETTGLAQSPTMGDQRY